MTSPAEPLSPNARSIGLDMSLWDRRTAELLATGGTRIQRRAAQRWLRRNGIVAPEQKAPSRRYSK